MNQPSCDKSPELLPSRDLLAEVTATLPTRDLSVGMWFWGLLFAAVLVFEIWTIATGRYTLSETVWHGPKWFRWALGLGFGYLLYHLFLER